MSYTINISKKIISKKELTEAEIAKMNFNKMSAANRINKLYDMLMDHEARISALESEPTSDPDPTPEQPTMEAWRTFKFNIQGIDGTYNFVTTGDVRALDETVEDIKWLFGVKLTNIPDGLTYENESPIDTSKIHYISKNAFDGEHSSNIYYFDENNDALGVINNLSLVLIDNVEEQPIMNAGRKFRFEIKDNDENTVGSFEFETTGDATLLNRSIRPRDEEDIEWLCGGRLLINVLTKELTDENGISIANSIGSSIYYISKKILDNEVNTGYMYYSDENSKTMKKIKINNGSELIDAFIILNGEVA